MLDWKNTRGWSVLVVDDEPDNLEVVATVLSFFGMTVKAATDGIQGLEVLKDLTPTLILLDLAMPHMDGWRMFKEIRNIPRLSEVPIVALTAHAMIGDEERVLAAGFNGYLSKPVSLPTLVQDIEETLTKNANRVINRAASVDQDTATDVPTSDTVVSAENPSPQEAPPSEVVQLGKPVDDLSVKEIPQ